MEGLGRLFNIVPTADGVWVNTRDSAAVSFVCVNADTFTIQDATSAAGAGAANLAAIRRYYTNPSLLGIGTWSRVEQAAAASITIAGATAAMFTVDTPAIRDGFRYLLCSSTAAGLVYALLHDFVFPRPRPGCSSRRCDATPRRQHPAPVPAAADPCHPPGPGRPPGPRGTPGTPGAAVTWPAAPQPAGPPALLAALSELDTPEGRLQVIEACRAAGMPDEHTALLLRLLFGPD
jgi:hypothetical protein